MSNICPTIPAPLQGDVGISSLQMRNLRLRETPQKPEVKWKQTFSRSVSQRSWECFGGACPQSTCFPHKSRGAFRHVLLCAVSTTGDSYIGRSRPCCTSAYSSRNLQVIPDPARAALSWPGHPGLRSGAQGLHFLLEPRTPGVITGSWLHS